MFVAHAIPAVSVGLRCCVHTSRGSSSALSSLFSLGSLIQVLHFLLLSAVSAYTRVSPVFVFFAALSSLAPLPSTSLVSLPSEFLRCSCSPRVHLPLPHLRFVLAVGQSQGVMWEARGPIVHQEPWGSALGQPGVPSVRPSQGPSI